MSGYYLALEGVEGAGKSTIGHLLVEHMERRGLSVVLVREPGGTDLGEEVRRLLLHSGDMTPWSEAALFAASRAQLVAEVVAPALAEDALVISDRTYYSSLAYQGHARGLGVEAVRQLNEAVLAGAVPDLVAVLDLDPDLALGRQLDPDRIGAAGSGFQRMVAEGYHKLSAEEPEKVILLSADREPAEIVGELVALIDARWRHV